jgi:hypothetical protein
LERILIFFYRSSSSVKGLKIYIERIVLLFAGEEFSYDLSVHIHVTDGAKAYPMLSIIIGHIFFVIV